VYIAMCTGHLLYLTRRPIQTSSYNLGHIVGRPGNTIVEG